MKRSTVICLAAIAILALACVLVITLVVVDSPSTGLSEDKLKDFLENEYDKNATYFCHKLTIAEWEYQSDLNNEKKQSVLLNVSLKASSFNFETWEKYFKNINPKKYKNKDLKRQAKLLKIVGIQALEEEKLITLKTVLTDLTNIYGTAKICPYRKQNCNLAEDGLSLEPEIEAIFAKSTNHDELVYAWKSWRDASGAKMRTLYKTYVDLNNEAAVANNFKDTSELWLESYESPTFVDDVDELWTQVEPLYLELHKYVGRKLQKFYGDKVDTSDGLLPAHIFGNVWAQDWLNLFNLVKPFPAAGRINVDEALKKQNFTVLKMFKTADNFYKSMGLLSNQMSYDTSAGAIIEKPTNGKELICHASAWDFCNGQDYRIKMCTSVNYDDFVTIHHEMGHIQYFQQYSNQPYVFRTGANPGFHEAVGDTIALSVSTPKHLEKIGLVEYSKSYESSINALMDIALQKIPLLPFALVVDKWRFDVFSGRVHQKQWNSLWWQYRKKYQRVKPPVERSEDDFDPGAKYHIAADVPYIQYFVADILQFQFYKSLCVAAGEYDPSNKDVELHECDFYGSKDAGKILSDGLSLGGSKHWSEALKLMTGDTKMKAAAILEYFEPLRVFLEKENAS